MYHPQDKNAAYQAQAYHPPRAGETFREPEQVNRTTILVDGGRRPPVVDDRPMAATASTATTAGGAALKVFEIILAIIILCLICVRPYDENPWWAWTQGEEWTIFACVWALFFCMHFLLQYLSGCHRTGYVYYCKCGYLAGAVYALAAVFFIIAGGIEVWMTTLYGYWGRDTRYNMRAAASAFCFLEAILFLLSAALSRFKTI
jgi:hypothetical protein